MAMCVHRVLDILEVDDPGQISRVAVRFASPTPLGGDVTVRAHGGDEHAVFFEAVSGDATVITHGRLELRT